MTKNKASTVAEKVPKKPRREDTATADGGPTVEDEPTVVAPGCPEFIGGLVVSFCKRNGSVVLAAHHAPSTEQREGEFFNRNAFHYLRRYAVSLSSDNCRVPQSPLPRWSLFQS
ncbi:Os08g0519000 [Oryza sativa Japonica Group]|uniref:Os08g0519000 protein n=1 Tax=Oryza sativa subsp. japonica TaxID=39947 RepID=Q0J4E4_ORYSJ|nr:Os08g0519000 [Oryza sativa Japonica Group]|eukprot:NP_001062256.2 Os08g0519000 [Oryza sativa Japonica Group]